MTAKVGIWASPVWVDFSAMDAASRVPLDFPGTIADLARHQIDLRVGLQLGLYDHDSTESAPDDPITAIGRVEYDEASHRWCARFDWRDLQHVSEWTVGARSAFFAAGDITERRLSPVAVVRSQS
jgi:hypothetical protein